MATNIHNKVLEVCSLIERSGASKPYTEEAITWVIRHRWPDLDVDVKERIVKECLLTNKDS